MSEETTLVPIEVTVPPQQVLRMSGKKLVLVDAYSLLFRAFFAGRYLSTSDNRPTGALFGFSNMLFSILNNEKPDAIVVCWDAPGPTHRSLAFEAYKAHRPDVDSQLIAQFPPARDIVTAFGIQSAELKGYEADDLIGTLAVRGKQEGYGVVIVTGDSDQLQLIDDNVRVHITQKGVTEVKIYDAEAVRERYGIGPERIADYKALVGDTSDNIPGVPGIGDKTATALLQKFGSLENLLQHLDEAMPPRAKAALEANVVQARFSLELATIVCDAPIDAPIRPYAPTAADWNRLRTLFADLEFRSLMNRIPKGETATAARDDDEGEIEEGVPRHAFTARAAMIGSQSELNAALQEVRNTGRAGIRFELEGDNPLRAILRGVAFAPSAEAAYYMPVQIAQASQMTVPASLFDEPERPEENPGTYQVPISALKPLFEDSSIKKSAYNAKPMQIILERAGLHPEPFEFDALIAAYLLEAGRSSYPLVDLISKHLDAHLEADDAFEEGAIPMQEAAALVAVETPMRQALSQVEMDRLMDEVDMPLIPVLASIEVQGLRIDLDYLGTLGATMGRQIEALAEEIYALAGMRFNIGSPKQLQEVLFEKLQLPTGKKTKTGYSTGADLLEQLAPQYEICRKIIDYREVAKLKSTYTDALTRLIDPVTHRVHTSLNQTVASTGRLSSSDPNLQNIPVRSEIGREIRRAFIAPEGKTLLSCDYSQVELRILAHVTKDPTLVSAFAADEDIHVATAATVFGVPITEVTRDQRRQAKTINFAVIYGQSAFALAATLGVSNSVASEWIKEYFERLPGVKTYVDQTTAEAHKKKYVKTLLGRRRYMPELDSGNFQMRQAAERAAVNMPIQGTAADIMKLAMIRVHRYLQDTCEGNCTLLLQVHDELLFELEPAMISIVTPEILRLMSDALPLDVPLKVDAKAGPSWAEMDPL